MTQAGQPKPRHNAVAEKITWLIPNPNLPPHLRGISEDFESLAHRLLGQIDDGPQLTLALQHLIDAKDCAVRARIASEPAGRPIRGNPQA